MRREQIINRVGILILAAALLVPVLVSSQRDDSWPEVRRYPATMVRVVDGDTFDVTVDLGFDIFTDQRLRLAVVDAWETRGEEKEKGLKAKGFVEQLAGPGASIVVITDGKKGKYGRVIASIDVGGMDLGTELLENGHAEYYK